MRSSQPKVVMQVAGRPMIAHIVETLAYLGFGEDGIPPPTVVVGFDGGEVREAAGYGPRFVIQREQLGTGHAVRVGLSAVDSGVRRIVVIHGDEPLIAPGTYQSMLKLQGETEAAIVLLTGNVKDTHGLGRVIRDRNGQIVALVQEKELTREQRRSHEINFGAYVFDRDFLEWGLQRLELHEGREYYLTDLVQLASASGLPIENIYAPDPDQQMGVNDREQLERADRYLRSRARLTSVQCPEE